MIGYLRALPPILLSFLAATSLSGGTFNRDPGGSVAPRGNVPAFVRSGEDRGPTRSSMMLEDMMFVLSLRSGAEADLQRLLAEQQDPQSDNYHRWLSPEEYGRRFGVTDQDLAAVTSWLNERGFVVGAIAAGRGTVHFSGTVEQVESAFNTSIHDVASSGAIYHANITDPYIPASLAGVVSGISSLTDHPKESFAAKLAGWSGGDTNLSGGTHGLSPSDFATIYNTAPLLARGIDGRGVTIAVVGRSNVHLIDIEGFRSQFGLAPNDPSIVLNGTDPGDKNDSEELEADLDVQWAGATAPAANVVLVLSKSTFSTDGVDLSAEYIVNHNLAPVMTTSFGDCEDDMGAANRAFYFNLWMQAAAEGISSFVSSGDSGAAGCDDPTASVGTGFAVSGLASTPFAVAVGGTEFMDQSNPSAYWSARNDSTTLRSAISYIPEAAWNESGGNNGLFATGGGVSFFYAKPSWQAGPGVSSGTMREVPDVSLTAAAHDGYLVVQDASGKSNSFELVSGTSAATPSFAGLMALVVQTRGGRQGNPAPTLYRLAQQQATGGAAVFHDVVTGGNGVPGVAGYNCTTGYDSVTGLGSVDASALVDAFGAPAGRRRAIER